MTLKGDTSTLGQFLPSFAIAHICLQALRCRWSCGGDPGTDGGWSRAGPPAPAPSAAQAGSGTAGLEPRRCPSVRKGFCSPGPPWLVRPALQSRVCRRQTKGWMRAAVSGMPAAPGPAGTAHRPGLILCSYIATV